MVYFVSDFHLGSPTYGHSRQREIAICAWLDSIKSQAKTIYFLGDTFDFWFEYKSVIPKGFVRFLGKLAELHDLGIELNMFVGNHDLWIANYLTEECGVNVFRNPQTITVGNNRIHIHHGDGLGPGDKKYKFLKKVFTNGVAQFLFKWIHPDMGVSLASYFSRKSRSAEQPSDRIFKGTENEYLVQYAESVLRNEAIDFFIFGHRHLALDITLSNGVSRYINLGEWFVGRRYVVVDQGGVRVMEFVF